MSFCILKFQTCLSGHWMVCVHWEENPPVLSSKQTFPVTWVSHWTTTLQSKWMATWQSQWHFMQQDLRTCAAPCLIYAWQTMCVKMQGCRAVSSSHLWSCTCCCWWWSEDFCPLFSLTASWRWLFSSIQNVCRALVLANCQWGLQFIEVSAL